MPKPNQVWRGPSGSFRIKATGTEWSIVLEHWSGSESVYLNQMIEESCTLQEEF